MFSVSGSMLEIYFTFMSPQKQVTDVSLVLKNSDTESEKPQFLIRLSVSDSQKQTVQKMYHLYVYNKLDGLVTCEISSISLLS